MSAPGVHTATRAHSALEDSMIKHGEITALEDSKAAPQKLNHQYMSKKSKLAPQVPQTPQFLILINVIIHVN